MGNTTKQTHWEMINTARYHDPHGNRSGLRAWFSRPPMREIFYRICDRYFSVAREKKVIEVGCAPGRRLLEFARRYGYEPYGVEYTQAGVDAVRTLFVKNGIPEKNCIASDFFDAGFQNANRNTYDAVISFGFIEHFSDTTEVINAHINLLKPGGMLVIMIPRLRGIYLPLVRWLAPDLIPKHNLTIMERGRFRTLFPREKVRPLFADYYGVMNLSILQGRGTLRMYAVRVLQIFQALLNPILRHGHRFENRFTSPYLLFIGRKET